MAAALFLTAALIPAALLVLPVALVLPIALCLPIALRLPIVLRSLPLLAGLTASLFLTLGAVAVIRVRLTLLATIVPSLVALLALAPLAALILIPLSLVLISLFSHEVSLWASWPTGDSARGCPSMQQHEFIDKSADEQYASDRYSDTVCRRARLSLRIPATIRIVEFVPAFTQGKQVAEACLTWTSMERSGVLCDFAAVQRWRQSRWGYKRAAAAVRRLDRALHDLIDAGALARIHGIGPASTRIIFEVLEHGFSPTVEAAERRSGGVGHRIV